MKDREFTCLDDMARALAGDIALRSWARRLILTVPLTTQVHKWVLANLMLGVNPAMDQQQIQEGAEIPLVASCYRKWDRVRPDGPLGSFACKLLLRETQEQSGLFVLSFTVSTDTNRVNTSFLPFPSCDMYYLKAFNINSCSSQVTESTNTVTKHQKFRSDSTWNRSRRKDCLRCGININEMSF